MSTPTHIRMKELELGEILPVRSKSIPIIHDDDVSGIRREPKERKCLYLYKFTYEVQSRNGSSTSFTTTTGEKDIYVKCPVGTKKEDIDKMAYNKLESNFMCNDKLIDARAAYKKKIF